MQSLSLVGLSAKDVSVVKKPLDMSRMHQVNVERRHAVIVGRADRGTV